MTVSCSVGVCNCALQVISVQKYFRRMLAKCHADHLRLMARCQRERDELRLVMKNIESERRLQRDFERRLNPRTKDDFELLYNAMEGWRWPGRGAGGRERGSSGRGRREGKGEGEHSRSSFQQNSL